MASAAVTPPMRVAGWNVHLLAGYRPCLFAGVYQAPGSDLLTFRDVFDELRLCFEPPWTDDTNGNGNGSWDGIALGLISPSTETLRFVTEANSDQPVPSLPPKTPKRPNAIKYHIFRHGECSLPENSPLASHIKGS